MHVGFSGNHRHSPSALPTGRTSAGRRRAAAARRDPPRRRASRYRRPWLYATYGDGLDELGRRFHGHLRARPAHPSPPRPVMLNTWEAVYFDHDLDRLLELADRAAEVGVERFVLDDGWFRGRRDDRAGLGDWNVDADGLAGRPAPARRPRPRARHAVRAVVRAGDGQPRLRPGPRPPRVDPARPATGSPPPSRNQQVLDLANPDAYAYMLERLDALLTEYDDRLHQVGPQPRPRRGRHPQPTAGAGVHAQTLAVYRLHRRAAGAPPRPGDRVLLVAAAAASTSASSSAPTGSGPRDCNDPLERQQIQRWTGQLLPPELIGIHIGAGPLAHHAAAGHD